jgi:hypothetical protein
MLSACKKPFKEQRLRYTPTVDEMNDAKIDNPRNWPYTFSIDAGKLSKIGEYIAASRKTIPATFNAPWNDIFGTGSGCGVSNFRGVDYEEMLLYQIPTLFAPELPDNVRKPLLGLVKAANLALMDELQISDVVYIEK